MLSALLFAAIDGFANSRIFDCLEKEKSADKYVLKGMQYFYKLPDSSLLCFEKAIELANQSSDDIVLAIATYELGHLHFVMYGDLKKGKKLILRSLEKDTDSCPILRGSTYYTLGLLYKQNYTDLDSALLVLQLAEKSFIESGSPYRNWSIHRAMSDIFVKLRNMDLAHKYIQKALEATRERDRRKDHGFMLSMAIAHYRNTEDLENFSNLHEEYLEKYGLNKKWNSEELELRHTGITFGDDFNNPVLEEKLLSMLKAHESFNNRRAMTETCMNLGNLALRLYENKKAIRYFRKALKNVVADYRKMELLGLLSLAEARVGDYESALRTKNLELNHRDSFLRAENIATISNLEVQYETEKKDQQLQALNAEKEIQSLKLIASKRKHTRALLLSALLSLVAIFVIYAWYKNRESNRLLNHKNGIISKALSENELLLKEIHHRVKNNLQVISSLLYLQGEYVEDKVASKALQEGQNRVKSMALIHKNLYQEDNLKGINMKDYFDKLLESLFLSYKIPKNEVQLIKNVQSIWLDIDTVIPIALIVNELVSNSLEHAFKRGHVGILDVQLKESVGHLILTVEDNGVGISNDVDILNSNSFGFEMIRLFAKKLDANLVVYNKEGCKIQMEIKNYKKAS